MTEQCNHPIVEGTVGALSESASSVDTLRMLAVLYRFCFKRFTSSKSLSPFFHIMLLTLFHGYLFLQYRNTLVAVLAADFVGAYLIDRICVFLFERTRAKPIWNL